MSKVFVFGIDGAMPEKIFEEWLDKLPNIKKLMEQGCYAKLNSTIPPLSGTAWISLVTGKSPSDTGIFEYVYRKDFSYDSFHVVSSFNVKQKKIWEILSEQGKKTAFCFVPLTWPIKPFNGCLISGFMTPQGGDIEWAFPKKLKEEINSLIGETLLIDIPNFRNLTKHEIINEVYRISKMHLNVMKHILKNYEWELFFGIINGSDRLNHSFWRYCDKGHRRYEPNSEFKDTLKNYYKFLDRELGELIELIDEDAIIIVLSDHGIVRMHTRINLTDWLIEKNYMVLKEPLRKKCEFKMNMVNWSKTKAFAIGAYEGQIYINLKGREPQGIIKQKDYNKLIDELEEKLKKIRGDNGEILNTKIFKKEDWFKGECEDIAPDIIVYFDNLCYGCNTTLIGNNTLWSPQTAAGSDDAAHSQQGIFIMNKSRQKGNIGEVDILDVAPTILNRLNIKIPENFKGKVIN